MERSSRKIGNPLNITFGLLQYFFRVNSDASITILLEALDTEKTKIGIISSAGGTGWLAISYNAHGALVWDVRNFLIENGFKLENENEIPYFEHG